MAKAADVLIRDARIADSGAVARLAEQLGYSVTIEDIEARLGKLRSRIDEITIVAENGEGVVVGWATFGITEHIHSEPYVEVSGFIVDQDFRNNGIGKTMMDEVERWTKAKGLLTIRLHANVIRKAAHLFYQAIGFEKIKEQYAFRKELKE
jgi:ribosomal protein S18 acetylase RimI-like enzyme